VRRITILAALFCALSASGAPATLHIVTSFFPVYCWTANVAGDNARVENLLTTSAEPHDYAFKVSDARRLSEADLIVINGLDLEVWLPRFLRTDTAATNKIISATTGLEAPLLFGEQHHHHGAGHPVSGRGVEHPNEHVWLDPILAAHGVTNILAALQRIDARHAADYARNAAGYVGRLHQLDAEIRQSLANITNRAIVTYHDAFPYFAQRYGLEIAGVVEKMPDVNPTPKYLSRLGRTMRERGIRVIFTERGSMTRVARRIAQDLRVELVELDALESGPLTRTAYEERMRHNATVLRNHLK
jgi:zinc/manganese transport system substrate-binding protein